MTRPPCAKEPMSGTVSSTVEFWPLCPWWKRSSVPIRFRRRPTEAGDHTSPWVDTTSVTRGCHPRVWVIHSCGPGCGRIEGGGGGQPGGGGREPVECLCRGGAGPGVRRHV